MATQTLDQMAVLLGQRLRALRLRQNVDQQRLAARAGVALNALKNLESGKGGTTRSLLKVLRALGREDWLDALCPQVSISPLLALTRKPTRQRASRKRT
ncbi:MAG: helix-turn-helix transcriptional regulator [Acidobacteria bacterium]|nr:helix-turn-helix transcriptional regulator [Acidobacteriota bacterium]